MSLYVNTVFYEHAHHIYYPSRVVKEDRGEWTASPTAADELWQPIVESGRPNVLLIDHRLNTPGRRQDCGPLWESLLRVVYRCTLSISGTGPVSGELGLG